MAATVKTLLEHHGELYWGTRKANPGYCYGLALDVGADGLAAELIYVMSDLDENDEPLVTPETLVSCFTVNDLEDNGIILSNYLDDEDAPEAVGWYCIEKSFFGRDNVEALLDDNARLDGYLDIVLQILLISPEEVAQGMPSLDELSFFDLLEELEGVAEHIDNGDVQPPLPFSFRLVGDALFGWEHAMCGKIQVLAHCAFGSSLRKGIALARALIAPSGVPNHRALADSACQNPDSDSPFNA